MVNNEEKSKQNLQNFRNSMIIEPISCELSKSMKAHIEMMEWTKKNFHKYVTKMLMIPK